VDGMVSSTGDRGLGGKQVWLRSGIFGNSLYYAHLDSIIASTGQRVKVGDTLGLVGNTGNARTTPPHLHFGIYKRGRGAINPLPFVFEGVAPIPSETNKVASRNGIVNASTANLRNAASIEGKKIGEVKNKDSLEILGISTSWYRVKTRSGYKAYIHQNLLRPTGN
ncbi:MAG: M23 family metallopeptidase, partial [Leeuwenhoekiella sp.]